MSYLSTRDINIELDSNYVIDNNLHIKVSVVKSTLALPNSAKVEIYNISETTFKKLVSEPKIKITIDDELLFTGRVLNAPNEYIGTSWKCTIYCNDVKVNPYSKPQFLTIPKGTQNEDILKKLVSTISDVKVDLKEFKKCAKAKGSLMKQMVVEYKKEHDIMKSLQNMFKGCDTEVVKEDGTVKLQNRRGVPNISNPLQLDTFLEAPKLSHKDLVVVMPLNTTVKLGLGFKVKAKSISKTLQNPYTYKNQFNGKVYRIVEFTHEIDNFSSDIAKTTLKGLNYA